MFSCAEILDWDRTDLLFGTSESSCKGCVVLVLYSRRKLCPMESSASQCRQTNFSTMPLKVWDAIASERKQSWSKKIGSCHAMVRGKGRLWAAMFDQLNAHILEHLLFCWRSKMCACSWSKHGRSQSPLLGQRLRLDPIDRVKSWFQKTSWHWSKHIFNNLSISKNLY